MWTEDEVGELLMTPHGRAVFARWRARASLMSEARIRAALEAFPLPGADHGPGVPDRPSRARVCEEDAVVTLVSAV